VQQLAAALAEPADGETHGLALVEQSLDASVSFVERLDEASEKATRAMALIERGPALRRAKYATGWVRLLRGEGIDDLDDPVPAGPAEPRDLYYDHRQLVALRHEFRGELGIARSLLAALALEARERGDEEAWAGYQHVRCEVEVRAGDVVEAAALLGELASEEHSLRIGTRSSVPRMEATLACLRGDGDRTRALAGQALDAVTGQRWDLLEIDRVLGVVAVCEGDFATAVARFRAVWSHCEREGVDEPGVFPVGAELAEAALAIDQRPLATDVIERLARLATEQAHPWGSVSVRRCRALLVLSGVAAWDEAAHEELLRVAGDYAGLGWHFDAGRTLLALGREARRARKWAIARAALSDAASRFDALGCLGWSDHARSILEGLAGRKPGKPGDLTPSERRAAVLASEGRSNKQIAAAMFVSVHTVEVHLGRAYGKLGVESRSQLAKALAGAPTEAATPIN
jgi:DNA-binding CsgD family transcriptional regulator